MSISLYDKALLNKLNSWTTDTSLQVYSTESATELFKITGDQNNDESIKLPIIVLRRVGGFTITNTTKKLLVYDGKSMDWNLEKSIQLNAIPVSIDYQIDVYARKQEECDEITRNLIFNLIIFPNIDIELPYYDKKYIHRSSISLMTNVDDNSDIKERLSFGQFTRFSIGLAIRDAYLFDVRERNNYSININEVEDISQIKKYTFNIDLKTDK